MTEELTPRERRYQRTQQAILDAALELIHEKGVDGLSIRAIAERIDYSPAGLYEYYGSKEEIVGALCLKGFERFARHLASVDATLPANRYMNELGVAYVDFALRNSDFFLLMFTTAPMLFPQIQKDLMPDTTAALVDHVREDDAFRILVNGVERCVAEGLFQPQADFGVLEAAQTAWSLAHGIAMLQLTVLRQFPLDNDKIRAILNVLFHGMLERGGVAE